MEEKLLSRDTARLPGDDAYSRSRSKHRRSWRSCAATAAWVLLALFLTSRAVHYIYPCAKSQSRHIVKSRKVDLEAHIMSKCPDAKVCLEELVVPVMANVSDKVNFALSYIGSVSSDDDVECMHGPEECLGNIIELCAADLYPDPKIYLGFTMCLTKDFELIPQKELIHSCALEHGMDFDKLNHCASKDDGAFGMDLLRNSVTRTANANVTKSCTVRLDGEIRCIRDGGKWKDCPGGSTVEELISDIKDASKDVEDNVKPYNGHFSELKSLRDQFMEKVGMPGH